jgi:peptidoglycan/xylan/chitin deacetylase (PgdA/CDA1 family)
MDDTGASRRVRRAAAQPPRALYPRVPMAASRLALRSRRLAVALAALAIACAALLACAGGKTSPRAATPPRAAADRGVPILLYHRISSAPAGTRNRTLWVDPPRFRRQIDALARAGYHGVTLGQVWRHWHHGAKLPSKPIVISFDDGYASHYANAFPVLRRHRWPGVLNLQLDRIDVDDGLSRARVKTLLRAGWELGDHTATHPDLTTVGADALRAEVIDSKADLEALFGVPVDFFCYPYGRLDDDVVQAVRDAGFLAATTTVRGRASAADDPFRLDRIIASGNATAAELTRRVRQAR